MTLPNRFNVNQNACLRPLVIHIIHNTGLRKKATVDFEKEFFKLMNNAVFGIAMENIRKHKDIKLVTTERRNYLLSERYYHTTKFFPGNVLATEKKKEILMNKPAHLGLFDTSNYELECNSIEGPLPKRKKKKVIGLRKDELVGTVMTKSVGLRAKNYSYLIHDSNEDKKIKGTKICAIKRKVKFENYKTV